MKLVTTMGIELTYMPAIWDWLAEQYGKKYNEKYGHGDAELANVVKDRGESVCFAARNLRTILQMRKVPHNSCGTDPDCVEVSTKPYKTLEGLMRRANVIGMHAADLDLVPSLTYFNGGGAHIHTGTAFVDKLERENYVKRMMVFAAKNPWLSWAFIGLNDDTNAEPLTQRLLHIREDVELLPGLKTALENEIAETLTDEALLHTPLEWGSNWDRTFLERRLERHREMLMSLRLRIASHNKPENYAECALDKVTPSESKDYVIRWCSHLRTCEFRSFEMPSELETLAKYVRLANAICTHVSNQNYTYFDATLIPKDATEVRMIPLASRLEGFRKMLEMVGMDPAEFKAEERQIKARFKWYKDKAFQTKHKREEAKRNARELEIILRRQIQDSLTQITQNPSPIRHVEIVQGPDGRLEFVPEYEHAA